MICCALFLAARVLAAAPPEPEVQILQADIDRRLDAKGEPRHTVVVTGRANLAVKKATIRVEGEGDSNFLVYLTTDKFPPESGARLVVKVQDKTFVPHSDAVEASYTVEILNAEPGASPISWKITLRKPLQIRVGAN